MNYCARIHAEGQLNATITRADGSHRDVVLSPRSRVEGLTQKLLGPMRFWHRIYYRLRGSRLIPAGLTLAAFVQAMHTHDYSVVSHALVTTAGINLLAADFVSGASTHIAAFNYHDSGVGTTAAAIGQTVLVTQSGPTTRATGTQTTPLAGQYSSVGTINYTSSLAITEWGLFSQAAQGGTLWDRRTFSAYNVNNFESITFQYTLTTTAGGS